MLRLALRALLWLLKLPFTLLRATLSRLRTRPHVLTLNLEGALPLWPAPPSLLSPAASVDQYHLHHVLSLAQGDPRIRHVRVRIGALSAGWGQLHAVRARLQQLRQAGLELEAFVAHPDLKALWLASVADRVLLAPHLPVEALGIGTRQSFYGPLLERLGVEVEVLAAGEYKSAMEPLVRDRPSPASREATEGMVADLAEHLSHSWAEARGLESAALKALIDRMPLTAAEAVEAGLADALQSEAEYAQATEEGTHRIVAAADYTGRPTFLPRWPRRPKLALIALAGTIRDGRAQDESGELSTAPAFCAAVDRARRDKRVRGVLLSIDSPGGSATASEQMYQAVRRLAQEKPVISLMGDVAASGGYYIAAASHQIIAAPTTLTGSIGVIAARPVIAPLLHRLGVARSRTAWGARAHLYDLTQPLMASEREALQRSILAFYDLFLERVATGRRMPKEAVRAAAEGRVWTGQQALARGLIDQLGDLSSALAILSERAQLKPQRALLALEPHRSFKQRLRRGVGLLSVGPASPEQALLRWLGPQGRALHQLGQLYAESPQRPWALCLHAEAPRDA